MRFAGKRALVTGGSSGIGRGIAVALVAEGADVYNFDINYVDIPGIKTVQVDLTDWEATDKCLEELGPVDLLFNNAGMAPPCAEMVDVTKDALDKTIDTNLKAPFHVAQKVAKGMIESGKAGSIVNTSSLLAYAVFSMYSPYAITKAGLQMMTKCMALELGPHNIRVNSINPTLVRDTPIGQKVEEDKVATERQRSRTPLGRLAVVKDIVGATLFLLSDEAKMVTGTGLLIDGGYCVS